MGKIKSFLVIVLLSLSSVCYSAEWYVFFNYTDDAFFYFDKSNIESNQDSKTIWMMSIDTNYKKYKSDFKTINKTTFYCKAKKIRYLNQIEFDNKNKLTKQLGEKSTLDDVIPDTVLEGLLIKVCAKNFPYEYGYEKVVGDVIEHAKQRSKLLEVNK
jgi:hypothetical protein